jgi:predicted ATPase
MKRVGDEHPAGAPFGVADLSSCGGPERDGPTGHVADQAVSRFVGRNAEIAQVERLVSSKRLVTLTGVAGVGKTRMAAQVCHQFRDALADGVCMVELAPVRDGRLVANTMAMALGVPIRSPAGPNADLVDFLRDKDLLLVVDGCEHLLDACAQTLSTLLKAAPGLRVLTTSRQPLGIAGEHLWTVPPLRTPGLVTSPGGPGDDPAVALFAERARTILPGFTVNTDNRDIIADICRQVDGLPLAIELAAARLADLSPEELLVGLQDRYRLLASESEEYSHRHESLRAAIDWSYALCSPGEQRMWQRLSVFPAGFDLDATKEVCADDTTDIHDTLALVDKSVLIREEYGGRSRYRLLDTLARYGQDKLRAADEETALRRRHRDWYLRLVEHRARQWFGPNQTRLVDATKDEHPDLRAALEFSLTTEGETTVGLHLAGTLWFYWIGCGLFTEGRYWLDRILGASQEPSPQRAKALWANGSLAAAQGDTIRANELAQRSRTDAEHLGDDTAQALATQLLGFNCLVGDDLPDATSQLSDGADLLGVELAKHPDDSDLLTSMLFTRVQLAIGQAFRGDPTKAAMIGDECRQRCHRDGERWVYSYALYALALAEWQSHQLQDATLHARESLRIKRSFYDLLGMVLNVDLLAWIAADAGACERAAILLGVAQRLWHQLGQPLFGSRNWSRLRHDCETRCRGHLGSHAFEVAQHRGSGFTTSQALAYAIAPTD